MTREQIEQQRKDLAEQLRLLDEQAAKDREARMKSTKRVWQFTFSPVTRNDQNWLKIRDKSVVAYSLRGTVVNKEECEAAGHSNMSTSGGSMIYLFNKASGKIIKADGGGHIFIAEVGYSNNVEKQNEIAEDNELVFTALEDFLALSPQGGDVTEIIKLQRHCSWIE